MGNTISAPADIASKGAAARQEINEGRNPLGLDGSEFIEYATAKPQALGQVLEAMGLRPIARHRSREVLLYRQGDINIIVNAHANIQGGDSELSEKPVIAAIALSVRDAGAAEPAQSYPIWVLFLNLIHELRKNRRSSHVFIDVCAI